MTIEEKRDAITDYCEKSSYCLKCNGREFDCPLFRRDCREDCDDETVEENFKLVSAMPDYNGKKETNEPKQDIVNHPSHYCQDGQMECIDEMVMFFGRETVKSFCLCNAWKYRYRANSKNGDEDLKKAAWYVHKYKELSELDRNHRY